MKLLRRLFGAPSGSTPESQIPLLNYSHADREMKCVYTLTDDLHNDPEQTEKVRRLTLDRNRPRMGLKGTYGLFASGDWWRAINSKRMPLLYVSGVITRAYEAGQDRTGEANTVEIRSPDGRLIEAGIYTNTPRDAKLFEVGRYMELVYALDPLKAGGASQVALESAISVKPTNT